MTGLARKLLRLNDRNGVRMSQYTNSISIVQSRGFGRHPVVHVIVLRALREGLWRSFG